MFVLTTINQFIPVNCVNIVNTHDHEFQLSHGGVSEVRCECVNGASERTNVANNLVARLKGGYL